MRQKLQFAGWLMALCAVLAVSAFAQGPRANWAQNKQDNKPPKQQQRQEQGPQQRPQQQRQEQRRENRQPRQESRRTPNERQNSGANRPPSPNPNRADMMGQPNANPNRPPSSYTPPQKRDFNSLSPREKQKVLPKWQQLPPDRKRAIQQRLGVLKNMPESARNQHLNDPNFTRGMSEEDKATLRDLSHLHVGGAPEPPNE